MPFPPTPRTQIPRVDDYDYDEDDDDDDKWLCPTAVYIKCVCNKIFVRAVPVKHC